MRVLTPSLSSYFAVTGRKSRVADADEMENAMQFLQFEVGGRVEQVFDLAWRLRDPEAQVKTRQRFQLYCKSLQAGMIVEPTVGNLQFFASPIRPQGGKSPSHDSAPSVVLDAGALRNCELLLWCVRACSPLSLLPLCSNWRCWRDGPDGLHFLGLSLLYARLITLNPSDSRRDGELTWIHNVSYILSA